MFFFIFIVASCILFHYVNKTNKCTYTSYIVSSLNKTLKSLTCFGLIDHPQGVCSVPRWLLKCNNIRKILVSGTLSHSPFYTSDAPAQICCHTILTSILRILLHFNNQRGTEHTPWGWSIRPKHVGDFNVLLSELTMYEVYVHLLVLLT
jgi:hypothetical protein